MRFVALAIIPLSLPIFIALLNAYKEKRDWALLAIGVLLFVIGTIQLDGAIITWRLWQGYSRGIFISLIDGLALALIFTRARSHMRIPLLGLMLLYLVPSTLSLMVSTMPMATLFVPLQTLRVILMVVAIAGELRRFSALRHLCSGMAIGLMIQAGFVIRQKLSGAVQATGTADHQNILGMMVVMALIPLVALVLEGERRIVTYAGIIAGLIVVAGGGSRATMGFSIAGLVLLLVLSLWRRVTARKGKVLGIALLIGMIFIPLGFATLTDRFGGSAMENVEDQRPAFEQAARSIAADYPFGVGANTYVLIANGQGYSQRAGVSWFGGNLAAPVHNSFLLMRAEMGWLGQLIMLAILIVPIIVGMRMAFADRRSPLASMGISSAVVATIAALHCNFEYAWHLESVQRLYFTNLAILSAVIMVSRETIREKARAKRQRLRTAQTAAA